MLSREAILNAQDRPTEDVEVPEWGGTVRVQALGCDAKDALDASLVKTVEGKQVKDLTRWRRTMLALSLVDENGRLLFSEKDADALGQKSPQAADRIIAVAVRLSFPQGADIEALEKN